MLLQNAYTYRLYICNSNLPSQINYIEVYTFFCVCGQLTR